MMPAKTQRMLGRSMAAVGGRFAAAVQGCTGKAQQQHTAGWLGHCGQRFTRLGAIGAVGPPVP